MSEPVWVLQEVVVAAHRVLLAQHGGSNGIRDRALLDSALARPPQRFAYDEEVSIFELAAAYSFGLAGNHPFVDGNKRIALTVGALFLELNGCTLDAPEAEAVVIFELLAAGKITETELADWFKDSSVLNAPKS